MPAKTFAELEAQAQAMVDALTAQRNAAQDQNAMLMGHIAILELRLKVLAPEAATLSQGVATGVEQSG